MAFSASLRVSGRTQSTVPAAGESGFVTCDQGKNHDHTEDGTPNPRAREHSKRVHTTDSFLATCVRPILSEASWRFTCSGQMPKAMMRAARSRTGRKLKIILAGTGIEGAPSGPRDEETTRRWAKDWKACIARVGSSRLSCTAIRSR